MLSVCFGCGGVELRLKWSFPIQTGRDPFGTRQRRKNFEHVAGKGKQPRKPPRRMDIRPSLLLPLFTYNFAVSPPTNKAERNIVSAVAIYLRQSIRNHGGSHQGVKTEEFPWPLDNKACAPPPRSGRKPSLTINSSDFTSQSHPPHSPIRNGFTTL
jgi:hypothetical protein